MNEWTGRQALITGASSGIGRAFAKHLARQGANLVLTARSIDRLRQTADSIIEEIRMETGGRIGNRSVAPIKIELIEADLARPESPQSIFEQTTSAGLTIDLLINNAGFGMAGPFADQMLDRQLEMIQVNVNSLVALTRLYLPGMIERKAGAIVQVASTAAFQGVPWLSLYAGTKALVMNFSEGLATECRDSGVRIMGFCPGPTESAFHQTTGALPHGAEKRMPTADQVAEYALQQLERHSVIAVQGRRNRFMIFMERFAPRHIVTRMAAGLYRPKS